MLKIAFEKTIGKDTNTIIAKLKDGQDPARAIENALYLIKEWEDNLKQ